MSYLFELDLSFDMLCAMTRKKNDSQRFVPYVERKNTDSVTTAVWLKTMLRTRMSLVYGFGSEKESSLSHDWKNVLIKDIMSAFWNPWTKKRNCWSRRGWTSMASTKKFGMFLAVERSWTGCARTCSLEASTYDDTIPWIASWCLLVAVKTWQHTLTWQAVCNLSITVKSWDFGGWTGDRQTHCLPSLVAERVTDKLIANQVLTATC